MNILIFKTNIATNVMISAVQSFLNSQLAIIKWSIDTEDIDNVLRVVAVEQTKEQDVINLIEQNGFVCEILR